MLSKRLFAVLLATQLASGIAPAIADVFVTQGSSISADISRSDGRIAMDLLGSIWILPSTGGEATLASDGLQQASRPRWSPDGTQILYQTASADGTSLWLLEVLSGTSRRLSDASMNNQFASWNPDGESIVFTSGRNNRNFDLWQMDLPTGLSWRLSDTPADEFEPIWSANGQDLAYIQKTGERYAIMLRRRSRPSVEIVATDDVLSALAWRPDGTMLTYLRNGDDGVVSEMAILSEPPLIREFASGEDFVAAPVSWFDRSKHIYTADGEIKSRQFGDWRSKPLPFRAFIRSADARPPRVIQPRELAIRTPAPERLVIRGKRLFDGIWRNYREAMDVLIADGKIVSVVPRREWADATVLDLGNVTILPGFIDSWSRVPAESQERAGLILLSYGVTTIMTDQQIDTLDHSAWEGEATPGPRLLPAIVLATTANDNFADTYYLASISAEDADTETTAETVRDWQDRGIPVVAENWNTHQKIQADMLLGIDSLPRSALDDSYAVGSKSTTAYTDNVTVVSGLADAATPGLDALLTSRQAAISGQTAAPSRRHSVLPQLSTSSASILLGSKPNGLPAGLALHAELRALQAAGLDGEQVLHTAGKNPAKTLGFDNQLGTITPGALADLVLVNGDPLANVDDALNIVAVVRNGRFYSLVRLLEQIADSGTVE